MSASPRRLVSVAVVAIVATLGCRASKAKQSTAESPAPAVEEPAPAGTGTAADRFPAADGWVRQNGLMHRAGPMPGTSHHGGARPRQALGVQLDDTDERDGGAVITYVYAGGPAQRSGLAAGDVVRGMQGRQVRNQRSLTAFFQRLAPGESAELEVARNGSPMVVTVTAEDAFSVFRRACDGGDMEGCTSAGMMLGEGDGVEADPAAARQILGTSCDAGSHPACITLGNMHRKGVGGAPDLPAAMALFTRSCDAGVPTACFNAGIVHMNGELGRADNPAASRYFGRACEMGDGEACRFAAQTAGR